jgi:hypothetical protein
MKVEEWNKRPACGWNTKKTSTLHRRRERENRYDTEKQSHKCRNNSGGGTFGGQLDHSMSCAWGGDLAAADLGPLDSGDTLEEP